MNRSQTRTFLYDPSAARLAGPNPGLTGLGFLDNTGDWAIGLVEAEGRYQLSLQPRLSASPSWSEPVSGEAFDALWPRTRGRRATYREEACEVAGRSGLIRRFEGALAGLVTVEVGFPDRDSRTGFVPPETFGPELTYDRRFEPRELAAASEPPCLWKVGRGSWSYGVIPFRPTRRGVDLVLVSTRDRRRWIFPKGQPEPGRTPRQVAKAEALEEAGLSGSICGHPLLLPYEREQGIANLLLFPFRVARIANRWQESSQRERRIIPLASAADWGDVVRLGALSLQDCAEAEPEPKNPRRSPA